MKKTLIGLAALALSVNSQAQTKWDLAAAYAATNFHTENLLQFASEVDKASSGKLKITVHANASLFKAPEIKRSVQGGQAQMGEILLVNFENENPLFGLDGIPFLATSYAESRKLYESSRSALDAALGKQGMMLLYAVAWPPQGIYSKKPLSKGEDLKGSKWRSYSPATAKMAELLGAQPVTVQAAELSQALATGVIETYVSSAATGVDTKTYESLKYLYDAQAWLPKNAVIVNRKAFDGLDKSTQQAVLAAAKEAETRGWKISEEKNSSLKQILRDKGMSVEAPSAQLMGDLRKVGNTMLEDWLKKSGDEGKALVNSFRK
ncbi:MAG: hypothetical protein RLZZ502_119 [Pseudomonadota bacterium]|jgi:TRAP-type C4-dicarboxylate transport system substrate-binding protein